MNTTKFNISKGPGLDLSTLRVLAYRVKPIVEEGGLFFIREVNLTDKIENVEIHRVLEANGLKPLGETEFKGHSFAEALLSVPEELEQKVSAFQVTDGKVRWYGGILPDVMYTQSFYINGQQHMPARSYHYKGPELKKID